VPHRESQALLERARSCLGSIVAMSPKAIAVPVSVQSRECGWVFYSSASGTLAGVYLVAPALRFHPPTDILLRYISPQIEFVRVGVAEGWRRGLRVVMRR